MSIRRMIVGVVAFAVVGMYSGCGSQDPNPPDGGPITPEINGGFEDVNPLTTHVVGWGSNLWDAMVSRSANAKSGAVAIEFYRDARHEANPEATLFSYRFEVTPGAEYALSFAAFNPAGPVRFAIAWYDNLGVCLKTDAGECAATTIAVPEMSAGYQLVSSTATVPHTAGRAYGDVYITATLPPEGRAYVDDVAVTPVR
jgi:hypothetical protein